MKMPALFLVLTPVVFSALPPAGLAGGPVNLLVPAYFYPPTEWDQLAASGTAAGITAILNPASGPGSSPDPNYVAAVANLRGAGGKVIGYVHTSYGARNIATVKAEIDQYALWYAMDGFFIDEMANDSDPGHLGYYADIYSHVKAKDPAFTVFGNPGTDTVADYLLQPCADTLVTYEDAGAGYPAHAPAAWTAGFSADHFANLIYGVPLQSTMESYVNLAAARNVGHIYVTDDVLSNPWDTLPPYWATEVTAAANAPEPGATALGLAGAVMLLAHRRRDKRRRSGASRREAGPLGERPPTIAGR